MAPRENEAARRQKSSGPSPTFLAFVLVASVAAIAAGIVFLTTSGQKPLVEGEPVEKVDPFEGLPEEEPPAPRKKRVVHPKGPGQG